MKRFTLIELLFVIMILVILIGISMGIGRTILRKSAEAQTKAEIKMISSAIEAYKERWGQLPRSSSNRVNFIEWLSNISPYEGEEDGEIKTTPIPRPMFIDCQKSGINVSNDRYFWTFEHNITVSDPYEMPYWYRLEGGSFKIISAGIDGKIDTEDDITN